MPKNCIVYINNTYKQFLENIKRYYDVSINFFHDDKHRYIDRRKEGVAVSSYLLLIIY